MEGTADNKKHVLGIAHLLEEHKAEDVVVLDLGDMNAWTDYFVIATVRSGAHLAGLYRRLYEYLDEQKIVPINPHRRLEESGWVLIDCGGFIVHLMEKEQREFYELEKLWYRSELLYHSLKSS